MITNTFMRMIFMKWKQIADERRYDMWCAQNDDMLDQTLNEFYGNLIE